MENAAEILLEDLPQTSVEELSRGGMLNWGSLTIRLPRELGIYACQAGVGCLEDAVVDYRKHRYVRGYAWYRLVKL